MLCIVTFNIIISILILFQYYDIFKETCVQRKKRDFFQLNFTLNTFFCVRKKWEKKQQPEILKSEKIN